VVVVEGRKCPTPCKMVGGIVLEGNMSGGEYVQENVLHAPSLYCAILAMFYMRKSPVMMQPRDKLQLSPLRADLVSPAVNVAALRNDAVHLIVRLSVRLSDARNAYTKRSFFKT